jgi:hypothetical protein
LSFNEEKIKYQHRFKTIGLFFSIIYWFSDSIIHYFVFGETNIEWIPSDAYELWMRALIIFLVFASSSYADHYTYLLQKKEQEKNILFSETVRASHHILNNLLNQMSYYKLLAEESHDFDQDELAKFDKMMAEAKEQILALEQIEEVTTEKILKLYP